MEDADLDEPSPVADAAVDPPTKPQDLPEGDRLRLLAGHLKNVDVPDKTIIPSRFGHCPDFGPRCVQCGHKQDQNMGPVCFIQLTHAR